jgi:hypothetical protein
LYAYENISLALQVHFRLAVLMHMSRIISR